MTDGIELFRQTAATTPPSLTDLVVVYPRAGLSPDPATADSVAETLARNNPPQVTTLQALANAVRPEQATTVGAGVVELATLEQARAGLDNTRAVTAAGVAAAIGRGGAGGGGAISFIGLNDTPSALGTAGQFLRVNSAADALEFTASPVPTGAEIVTALTALTNTERLPATAVRDLPAGTLVGLTDTPAAIGTRGQVLAVNADRTGFIYADQSSAGGGLISVETDTTLSGAGTSASPLSVVTPFTASEKSKLAGVEANAEVNVQADWNASSGDAAILNKPAIPTAPTATSVRNLLTGLTGGDRLPASAIRDLSAGVSAFTALTDTPSVFGAAGNLVRVNSARNALEFTTPPNSITAYERSKLAGIETGATADQTGAEMVSALSGLSGDARLPTTALRGGYRLERGRRIVGTAKAGVGIPAMLAEIPNMTPGRFYYFNLAGGAEAAAGAAAGAALLYIPTATTGYNNGNTFNYQAGWLRGAHEQTTIRFSITGSTVSWGRSVSIIYASVYEVDIIAD